MAADALDPNIIWSSAAVVFFILIFCILKKIGRQKANRDNYKAMLVTAVR